MLRFTLQMLDSARDTPPSLHDEELYNRLDTGVLGFAFLWLHAPNSDQHTNHGLKEGNVLPVCP
jgi:hypothetical protein